LVWVRVRSTRNIINQSQSKCGVNVGQFSVTHQHNLALGIEDGSMTDSAPNTGTQTGNALFEETGSVTRGESLSTLI